MMSSVKGAPHWRDMMEFVDVACSEPTADRVPMIKIVQSQCDKYTLGNYPTLHMCAAG